MSITGETVKLLKNCVRIIQKNKTDRFHLKKAKENYKALPEKKYLTAEQKKEIQAYYKRLIGKKVPLVWHQYFYSRTGIYAKEYLPTTLYRTDIIDKANVYTHRDAYVDKNMLDILLPNVKHPRALLKNMNGYYYMDGRAVSEEEVVNHFQNIDNVIIKPTLASHGVGVKKLVVKNGITNVDGKTLLQLLHEYKKDFAIQEFMQQHDKLSALNPTSVNTIRILTYRSGMEVIFLYSVIRIGRMGMEIDNESSGGISTRVNEDGTLGKYAYGDAKDGKIEKTDTGIVLEGYQLPNMPKAIETVKQCHLQLPFFNLIGWDVSIDKEGDPVIIEWNARTELSQSAFGPAFGEYTERIFKELWPCPNTHDMHW